MSVKSIGLPFRHFGISENSRFLNIRAFHETIPLDQPPKTLPRIERSHLPVNIYLQFVPY